MEHINAIPETGDRIIVVNVPEKYPFRDLYAGIGTVDQRWLGADSERVASVHGYTPYKVKGGSRLQMSCSGGHHYWPRTSLRFLERKPADFWQFKGAHRAGDYETYQEEVNWFEVDFNAAA